LQGKEIFVKLLADHTRHCALVLRAVTPVSHKLLLFDRQLGKIEGVVFSGFAAQRVCRGALLTYLPVPHKQLHQLYAVECMHIPFAVGKSDILFLHHMVELVDAFLPFEAAHEELFALLTSMVRMRVASRYDRKLLLAQFFILIGIYPEDEHLYENFFDKKGGILVDELDQLHIHLKDEPRLDAWLWRCVCQHPQVEMFKTIHFLRCESDHEDAF
jgi:hypothetical protein